MMESREDDFKKTVFAQHVLNAAGHSSSFAGRSVIKGWKMVNHMFERFSFQHLIGEVGF